MLRCEDEQPILNTIPEDVAWRTEFELPQASMKTVKELTEQETWNLLATTAKKQRSEVRLSMLNPQEKEQFAKAKESQIQNWIKPGTISRILGNQIPQENILKRRWILTCKPIDPEDSDMKRVGPESQENRADCASSSVRQHKAKARLVVLGYLDPNLEEVPRDPPTLSRAGRMLALQAIASNQWRLQRIDIKAAFLSAPEQAHAMKL